MNKKLIILSILTVVLVGFYVAYEKYGVFNLNKDSGTNETKEAVKTNVPAEKLPEKLPSNIPIEKNAVVYDNFNYTAGDNRNQSTRSFESKASMADNLKLYTDFMKQNDWKIQNSADRDDYKMVFGTKNGDELQVSIKQDKTTKAVVVTLSLTTTK